MEHFTLFELGQQDFARGEARPYWIDERGADRLAGYDSAYADSLAKAAGSLRRIHAGRYESEDGYWSIVETDKSRWSLLQGHAPGYRTQTELGIFPTFKEALSALRNNAAGVV